MIFGVQLIVFQCCFIHSAEAIRNRITLSHQAVCVLVHMLANPGDLTVTFILSDIAFTDSLQKIIFQVHYLGSLFLILGGLLVDFGFKLPSPSRNFVARCDSFYRRARNVSYLT